MARFRKFKRSNNKTKRRIIQEYRYSCSKTEYNEALRLAFSFIYSEIFQIAKKKKIYLNLDLTSDGITGCLSFGDFSQITISRKDISKLYELIESDATLDTCYRYLLEDIKTLPKEKQIHYSMELYRPTIFITAIYLMFAHEATHGFAVGSSYMFLSNYDEEKQCDTSASLMTINLYRSLLATFRRNNLLAMLPKETFEGALLMNIMLGVIWFTKYLTQENISETEDYLLHEDRRILYLIGTILTLPVPLRGNSNTLCEVGVNMYSVIFKVSYEEARNVFNNVAEKFDKLNN